MDIWTLMSYAAWVISALLLLWMVADTLRVNREYDEDVLISSREGADELLESGEENRG